MRKSWMWPIARLAVSTPVAKRSVACSITPTRAAPAWFRVLCSGALRAEAQRAADIEHPPRHPQPLSQGARGASSETARSRGFVTVNKGGYMNAPTAGLTQAAAATGKPKTISRQLAEFVAGFSYDAIPESIVSRAKSLILDAVGIALASTQYDFSHRTLSGIRSLGGSGDCSVIGMKERLPLRDAVLMNGGVVHGLGYDDTHNRA